MKSYLHKLILLVFMSFFTTPLIQSQNVLSFDGRNIANYVDCGAITLTTSYTKEAWIKLSTAGLGYHNSIVSGNGATHVLWVYNDNKLAAGHNDAFINVQDPNPLSADTWYHAAVTYDASTKIMNLYKNGLLVATNNSANPLSNSEQIYIGSYATTIYPFTGDMSNVRIWSVVRTQSQISMNMNTSSPSPQTGLVANYTCDQGTAGGNNSGATLTNVQGGANGTLVNFLLTGSTSNFILGNPILPVELLGFQAIPLAGSPSNLLKWQTANELNNKGFQVERLKASGSAWEILGFVAAQSPKGAFRSYEFTDNTPLSMSYYRLRQIDNDGKEVLSKVVSLALKGTKGFKVYPTIVSNGSLNVEVMAVQDATEAAVYSIYNLLGQQVLKGQVTQRIDISALPTGTYLIKVGTEQAKFVKQ